MATYTSAFTGSEVDTILAAVGTVAQTQSNLDTDCDTVITRLNNILSALATINTVPIVDDPEIIYNASVTAGQTIQVNAIDTRYIKKLWIFCDQTASQSLTVNVKALSSTTATSSTILEPMTLNTSTLSTSCYIIDTPPAIKFEIINNDTNATNVTITIVKTR